MSMVKKINTQNVAIFILLILSIILFVAAQDIETGAAMAKGGDFMPKVCSGIFMGLSALLLILNIIKEKDNKEIEDKDSKSINVKGFLYTLGLLFIYILLLKPIGFIIMSIIYLFLQILLFSPKEKRNYMLFITISIVVPVAVNYLFINVFSLILPGGLLK